METVRWGLLSTANINRRLIPAIRASDRGELVAVASRDKGTANDYAGKWGIPVALGSYEELLASDQIDCVYISLPNHMHAEWSIKAMQAGKHVLCEKPFALSVAEVDMMIAASQKYERVLAEAFMYRHHPQTKIAGEWVRAGRLGVIFHVYSVFNFKLDNPNNVRMTSEFGGGSLWDVGVYPLSFAQYIFGTTPTWVFGSQFIGQSGVDESFSGLLHYPNDGTAQIQSSFRSPFFIYAEIVGSEGTLTLSRPFTNMDHGRELKFQSENGEIHLIPVPEKELYLGEVDDMHAAILDQASPYLTLDESRNHIHTVNALYKSASQHKVVFLDSL